MAHFNQQQKEEERPYEIIDYYGIVRSGRILCKEFKATGKCRKMNTCPFSHFENEADLDE